jgi:phosphoketolase
MPNGYVPLLQIVVKLEKTRTAVTSPPAGRLMEILSEHTVKGWLEGYLLSGRHSLYARVRILRAKPQKMAFRLL